MDRSFLSKPVVIAASRDFVCVRLATYESKAEAVFLKSVFRARSGQLENTVFAILAPDGKRQLVRSGRSPNFAFFGAEDVAAKQMASTMNRIAAQFKTRRTNKATVIPPLPIVADLRLALNVAACDNQPLVVAYSPKANERKLLESRLAKLAWSDDYIGQFLYVSVGNAKAFKQFGDKFRPEAGIYVIEPDKFGLKGDVAVRVAASDDDTKLRDGLSLAVITHQKRMKETFEHRAAGRREGADWKTKIPVTDSHSLGTAKKRSPRRRSR